MTNIENANYITMIIDLSPIFRLASTTCLKGPIIDGRNENVQLGQALTFAVIFQKYAWKLIRLRIIEIIREKNTKFSQLFL